MAASISFPYLGHSFLNDLPRYSRMTRFGIDIWSRKSQGILLLIRSEQKIRLIQKSPPDIQGGSKREISKLMTRLVWRMKGVLNGTLIADLNSTSFNWSLFFVTSPPRSVQL